MIRGGKEREKREGREGREGGMEEKRGEGLE